jgi:hypothetical protein
MIDVASQATKGVEIPGWKATRAKITRMFKDHLTKLKSTLHVCLHFLMINNLYSIFLMWQSKAVSGTVNITCDAWQAGNTDGYFAVTGYWIEESSPMLWECKSALLGFTKVNNAHNGKHLGGALFKILDCVGIAHKI